MVRHHPSSQIVWGIVVLMGCLWRQLGWCEGGEFPGHLQRFARERQRQMHAQERRFLTSRGGGMVKLVLGGQQPIQGCFPCP